MAGPAGKGTRVETAANKVRTVMHEFERGQLHSGKGGPIVKKKSQAIAIAISEARRRKRQRAGA